MTLKPETKYSCVTVSIGVLGLSGGDGCLWGWNETHGHELRCQDRVAEADLGPEGLEVFRSFSTEALDTRLLGFAVIHDILVRPFLGVVSLRICKIRFDDVIVRCC